MEERLEVQESKILQGKLYYKSYRRSSRLEIRGVVQGCSLW